MPTNPRQMPAGSQVAFAKDWIERQGIESQTIDVAAHIDPSLSYEENIKSMKRQFGLGGGRSRQQAARGLTATECDVAIGNFEAGFNGEVARDACACGHPDACVDLERAKRAAKPKTAATPKFKTVEDAERWLEKKYAEHGGRWKFQATPEYKKVHPHLLELYGRRNRQRIKKSKQVNIVKNPYGTGYVIQFVASTNAYVGGGGMMGGLSTFETVDKAVREAKRSGYEIMSKPKATKPAVKPAPPELAADVLGAEEAALHASERRGELRREARWQAERKATARTTRKQAAKPKARKPKKPPAAAPKAKPKATKPKAKKTATTPKLTAAQREYLAVYGFVKVKRGGKFVKITN